MKVREKITSLEVSLLYPVYMEKSSAAAIREALKRLLSKAADIAEEAVEKEREACAQMVQDMAAYCGGHGEPSAPTAQEYVKAIRARGNE